MLPISYKKSLPLSLTPHYKERFGLEYTHYSRSDVEPYDTLETIRYLGRKFWACEGMMKAPLEEKVVLEMIYWIRGSYRDWETRDRKSTRLNSSHRL